MKIKAVIIAALSFRRRFPTFVAFYAQRRLIVVAFIEPEFLLSATMSHFLQFTLSGAVAHWRTGD